jgi:hypothetical protein
MTPFFVQSFGKIKPIPSMIKICIFSFARINLGKGRRALTFLGLFHTLLVTNKKGDEYG